MREEGGGRGGERLHAWLQSNAHGIHIVTGVRNVSRETWPVHDFIWWRDTGLQEITRKYAQPLLSTETKQEIFFFFSSDGDFIDGYRDSPPHDFWYVSERNRWLFALSMLFFDFFCYFSLELLGFLLWNLSLR